jgi:hypothetical protein
MGISLRAYGRHRGVTLAAVQKARQTGRIPVLADGTVEAAAADAAWDAAAAARRAAHRLPADPTRVVLPAGSLATAEATVRAVLAEHGAPPGEALTFADARLANELLKAKQRADAIAAQERECLLRLEVAASQAVDKRIVDTLVANTVRVITEYVPPEDVPAALDKLRDLQAHCLDRPAPVAARASPA